MTCIKCVTNILESNIGPWVVFEYMELGDLSHLLRSTNNLLSEDANTIRSPSYSLQQVNYLILIR